jgi:PAP2 superfamily
MDSLRKGLQPRRSGRADLHARVGGLALALLLAASASAQLLHTLGNDAKSLATAPFHWRKHEWARFGEGVALVAAAYAADPSIQRFVQRNRMHASDQFSTNVMRLGGGLGQDITIAMIAGGWLAKDDHLRDTGIEALESSVWASGLVTPALKRIAGRARPIHELGARSWHPFDSTYESFPSGHSTNAWAIATVIATRYDDNRVVPVIAYAAASSVSFARVDINVHWASDVIAGALIGRAVGKGIVTRHGTMTLLPARRGAVAHWRF